MLRCGGGDTDPVIARAGVCSHGSSGSGLPISDSFFLSRECLNPDGKEVGGSCTVGRPFIDAQDLRVLLEDWDGDPFGHVVC